MNTNKAFTFIEILVVITIISIISINSSLYFFDFIGKKELSYDISKFEDEIQQLDYQVKNQEIFDYKISLSNESLGYKIDKNNIGNGNTQQVIFNPENKYATIELEPKGDSPWELKIYQEHKKILQTVLNGQDSYTIDIKKNSHIHSSFSGNILNNTTLGYFESDNRNPEKLTQIINITDNNNTSTNSLTIENIAGKKQYYDTSNTFLLVSPITITFEKTGTENTLLLK
ncbi:MAG: prepilin-type N-terminal cleavage/methylation domain-containing protein [Candidatus Gracilibacteria bacterium]|nr:prepilin-type N-terminal cleavage/methylation domain-containing protein [Candidatus Gracilibacteria bacterium]